MLKTLNMANLPGIKVQQVFIFPFHALWPIAVSQIRLLGACQAVQELL